MVTGEWFIETVPKKGIAATQTEPFADDFDACFARALALKNEIGGTHHITVHAPARATDNQHGRLREAGFGAVFP